MARRPLVSHARGRWFEPSRAHFSRPAVPARARLARLAGRRAIGVGWSIGLVSRFTRRWCVGRLSRRPSCRRRRLSFGHVAGLARRLGGTAMPALRDCRRSACCARSKHSEHRRLATAPAGLGGRLAAAAGQHSSNCLHQLLRAALLRLAAAPACCTAAGPRRSACETPGGLSLTAGAAPKAALSKRCSLPPPLCLLCRPCHGISSLN
jgi:hypothetical protein